MNQDAKMYNNSQKYQEYAKSTTKINNIRPNNLVLFSVRIKNKPTDIWYFILNHAQKAKIVPTFCTFSKKNIFPCPYISYRILHISYISYTETHL